MHYLRLTLLGFALFFCLTALFESGSFKDAGTALLGSVGVNVGVAPNPYNTLAEQLRQKEEVLNAREQELNARAAVQENLNPVAPETASYQHLTIGGEFLFALILLNFYVDYRARRSIAMKNPG